MTILAVSIAAPDMDSFLEQLNVAQAHGAEAIEIRADALDRPDVQTLLDLVTMIRRAGLPVIVTCRDVSEGGLRPIDFSHRLGLYKKTIEAAVDFVDIEFRAFKHPDVHSVIKAALEISPTRLILSAHNFEGPFEQDIQILYEAILSLFPKAIPKIVFQARHINDCFAAYELLSNAESPCIAFCMGAAGQVSRILAKKLGAAVTYASVDEAHAAAPGQISVGRMKNTYRWDSLNGQTEIFGVIGNPVAHSLSPALFNACFESSNINALYLPFLVEGEHIEFAGFLDQVRKFPNMGFGGFSVTIPHKTHALDHAVQQGDYVEPLAVTIGSVNTLKIGFNGIISAYNTDYTGALEALTSVIGQEKHRLHQASVAVIGAGGVARAVIAGLTDAGAKVTIYNRTIARAEALAHEFGCKADSLDAVRGTDAEILINCTSIGMHPNTRGCPVPEGVLRGDMIVFDTVYNPLETELLKKAQAAGAKIVNGAEMFIRQAMAQYRIFIGQEPDETMMRQIVLKELSR